ncbi:unnamed protein product, partial [Mesorhabditis belari]|uniref:Uncharacterized protein n=1 Tax=Mesorhabditis belari TaxID=2138241 RepID=A0AAF3FLR6_9BILA
MLISLLFSPLQADEQSDFCRQFPSLALCKLPTILQGSYDELQYLLAGVDQPQQAVGHEMITNQALQKRKSAFVRFGKRSDTQIGDTEIPEKRKSAFVRFGRSDPAMVAEMEKRKSNYVRFG